MLWPKAALALLASLAITACSPENPQFIMHAVSVSAQQNYECVPLGWVPVPVDGTYDVGYSAVRDETDWFVPSKWTAIISATELKRPEARVAYELLNELVRVGMVNRNRTQGGFQYYLTWSALPYYFDQNEFGNNPEHLEYLCFSRIIPQRVLWSQPIHLEQIAGRSGKAQVFRAAVEWIPGPAAAWADDAMVRSHSVTLAPARGPIVVKFVNWQGAWEIGYVFATALPRLGFADASVWPRPRR